MGFFDWFKRKDHPGHILDDEDRKIGVETRQLRSRVKQEKDKLELERAKLEHELEMMRMRADLEALQDELYGDEDEEEPAGGSNEALLASILMPMLTKQQAPPQQQITPPAPSKRHYSDAEIHTLLEMIPRSMRKIAKKLPDDALIARARQHAPDADDETIEKAISIVRSW